MTVIRPPAVAGSFYPAEPDLLARQLAQFMAEAGGLPAGSHGVPKAIIGPHAGYAYSGAVAARGYARLAAARDQIRRVVLIGPSHYVAFKGLAVDTADAWATPHGTAALDHETIGGLRHLPMVGTLEAAYAREHALEVHLPFLQHVLGSFQLVPIIAGDTPPAAVAAVLEALWGGPETLIVVSTDLSHYLDYGAAQAIDARTAAAIERFDADAIGSDGACGQVAVRGLLLAARRRGLAIERLDLRNSGDTAGSRDRVVGYGAWALYPPGVPPAQFDDERAAVMAHADGLLALARSGIEIGFDTGHPGQINAAVTLPPLLAAPGAAFVTLRRNRQLRGCIGSLAATRPLALDVVQHAFNAAFRDGRFPSLGLLEVPDAELSVSVLTPPAALRIADEADLLAQLRPGIDGLIIADAGRRAVFLPAVWEEIPDRRHFLIALKRKAGLRDDHFSAAFSAYRFRSIEVKGSLAEPAARPGKRDRYLWTPLRRAAWPGGGR